MEHVSAAALQAPISVRWRVEADDLVRAERISQPRVTLFLRFGGPILIALAVGASLFHLEAIVSVPMLVLGLGLIFGQFGLYPVRIEKRVRGLAAHEVEVRAGEDGLEMDFAGSHSRLEWSLLTAITETETTVVVWRGRSPAFIVPRHAFGPPPEVAAFVAYVRARLVAPQAS